MKKRIPAEKGKKSECVIKQKVAKPKNSQTRGWYPTGEKMMKTATYPKIPTQIYFFTLNSFWHWEKTLTRGFNTNPFERIKTAHFGKSEVFDTFWKNTTACIYINIYINRSKNEMINTHLLCGYIPPLVSMYHVTFWRGGGVIEGFISLSVCRRVYKCFGVWLYKCLGLPKGLYSMGRVC